MGNETIALPESGNRLVSRNEHVTELQLAQFNQSLCDSIKEAVQSVLSSQVLEALYLRLERQHSITRDELPYRLPTLYQILEEIFGIRGARSIGISAVKKFYTRINLVFTEKPEYTFRDYIEEAKQKLV